MADQDKAIEQELEEGEAVELVEEAGADAEAGELSDEEQALAELKEAIGVEKSDVGPLRVKLTVTIPREFLDGRLTKEFDELRRDAVIPGFRKGHAPLKLVEKRFASDVGDQLKTQLVGSGFLAASEREGLDTVGDPLFWVKVKEQRQGAELADEEAEVEKLVPLQHATELIDWPKEGPLTFSCEVELRPQFELPKLEGIPLTRPDITVTDEDVQERIDRYRAVRGTFEPVEKGGIEPDDLLYGDMRVTAEGQELRSEADAEVAARDTWWDAFPLKGFGDAAKGKAAGDTIELGITIPDDYTDLALRGKVAQVAFKVNEIKRNVPAALNEQLLEAMGFESEQELRDHVRRDLESRREEAMRQRLREQVGDYLIAQTKFDIPEGVSARQTEKTLARRMIQLMQMGMPEAEVRKSVDVMRDKARDQVVRDLKLFFVLEKIAEERETEVSEERLNAAIAGIARESGKRFDRVRDELMHGDGMTSLYLQLRDEQLLDELIRDANISTDEGPKSE
ncbi:MAG: trigger factor [Phycisphaerae bacterium]|nr:trigger factor [Phycisphaerae bacterium]